jgi:hypothetical protein
MDDVGSARVLSGAEVVNDPMCRITRTSEEEVVVTPVLPKGACHVTRLVIAPL